jgi:hypothetical protein
MGCHVSHDVGRTSADQTSVGWGAERGEAAHPGGAQEDRTWKPDDALDASLRDELWTERGDLFVHQTRYLRS